MGGAFWNAAFSPRVKRYGMSRIDFRSFSQFEKTMPPTPEEENQIQMAITQQIAERIAPQLNECGVVAFITFAYVADAQGKVRRVTLGGYGADNNPAYHDGLAKIEMLAKAWSIGAL